MHIQQLEIDNFKSFSGKTVIPFRCGFTTVSGPNGSGKSNIVDSILFCLGLSTSRTMRAEKITDLINNSSRRREASVTITFNRGDAELPDALLQESFSEDEATQQQALALLETLRSGPLLTITRRIKATGATPSSSYYLNSRPSTLGEIHELLAKFNVSPGCYNVMMQGDVAHIVNMSAGERRKILDELAGVAEFDRKIEQAQKEIASASENLDKNQVLLNELERGLEELEQQRTQALRYQQLQNEAKQLEALLQVAVVRDLQRTLAELHTAKQAAHQHEHEAKQAVATAAKTLVQLRLAIEKQREAVKQEGHERHSQLNLRKQELTLTLQRREESQQQYTKKIADLETAKQSALQDMVVYKTETTTHEANLATVAQQEAELHELLATLKQEKDTLEQQQDALLGDATGVQQQRQQVRQQLEAVDDQLAILKREMHDYEAELERLELAQRQRLQTVASNATKLQQLEERYQKLHQSTQALEERQQTVQQQVRQKQAERNTLHAHTLRLKEQAQQKQERLFKLETFQQAQKAISNVYSVQTILNAKLPGVHGTLAQLLQVPTEYHLALEQALGGRLHHIVVDNEQVAQQGIQLLKSQNAGRATFLPLTKLRAFSNSLPPLPNSSGVIDYALELVSFDALHRIVYQQALGDTLIVEDARQVGGLINRYRMVALDGTVMEKSGSMAGGSAPKARGGSVFGQPLSNQQDAELVQVKQQLESLHTELAKCEKLLAKLDAELQHLLQQELQPLTTQVLHYQAQSNALEQQLAEERQILEAQQQLATQGDDTTAHARMKELQGLMRFNTDRVAQLQLDREPLQEALAQLEGGTQQSKALQQLRALLEENTFQQTELNKQLNELTLQRGRTAT
ncbi:MAG: AAA family ATPase, partial [Vampirovibrionales bacterium]